MAKLLILPPAARFLKKIKEKPLKDKYQAVIDQLFLDPYIGEPKSGDLSGIYCCDISYNISYNKTNYELAYTIIEQDEETIVVILAILKTTQEHFLTFILFFGMLNRLVRIFRFKKNLLYCLKLWEPIKTSF